MIGLVEKKFPSVEEVDRRRRFRGKRTGWDRPRKGQIRSCGEVRACGRGCNMGRRKDSARVKLCSGQEQKLSPMLVAHQCRFFF